MKTLILSISALIATLTWPVASGETPVHRSFKSAVTNGFFLELRLHPNAASSQLKAEADYLLHSIVNTQATFYIPKGPYLCRARLLDADGSEVPKTRAGKLLGSRFGEFSLRTDQIRWRHGGMESTWINGLVSPIVTFNSVAELFQVKAPGCYSLHLEFQFQLQVKHGTDYIQSRLRFPELVIPLEVEDGVTTK